MSSLSHRLPRSLTDLAAVATRPLPVFPLNLAFSRVMQAVMDRHPELLSRMGPHAQRRFWLDVTDMPWSLLLEPSARRVTAVHRRGRPPEHDVRIAGRLAAFLDMLHGTEDGDALFFARDLTVQGDTSAALAMRNAIDDAEIDLSDEVALASGRLAPQIARLLALIGPATGLRLRRDIVDDVPSGVPPRAYTPYARPSGEPVP